MNKTLKKTVSIVLIVCITVGALFGGLVLFRRLRRKPVNVFSVPEMAMTDDFYGMESQTYGNVTADSLQKVMLSETQTVTEIYVEQGQTVKEGDALLAFDTTLSDLDIKRAEINVSKLEMQKAAAEKELATIKKMKPHTSVLVTPDQPPVVYTPQETPKKLGGRGTEDSPYYYLWDEADVLDGKTLSKILPSVPAERTTALSGADETPTDAGDAACYVVLIVRENNALNAPVVCSYGLHIKRSGGEVSFSFFQPDLPDSMQTYDSDPEPYYNESGSDYTAAEIAKMRAAKEQEIKDLTVSVRIAQLELESLKKEAADGVVRSTVNGTVKAVRDPLEAYQNDQPVVEISDGGGYYITGAMSELELDTVKVGQTVKINSYTEDGMGETYDGKITEISQYPTTDNNGYYGEGNSNVSYYPFKVFVEDTANLREGDYADITYTSAEDTAGSIFLPNMFIRTENGKSFVFVKNADGLLEQRTVQTGKELWGYYTQVRGGLTMDDFIAFPYGTDVVNGAKTVEADSDALYEGAWF